LTHHTPVAVRAHAKKLSAHTSSQGLAGTKSAATSGSTSFHDLRIASLVAFITARLLAIR
jgi:hypothetical protein